MTLFQNLEPGMPFLIVTALIIGLYMAWNIGANDVANAMGTSGGSGALTLRNAVIVAAVLEFVGAFFAGSEVSETIRKDMLNLDTKSVKAEIAAAQKNYDKLRGSSSPGEKAEGSIKDGAEETNTVVEVTDKATAGKLEQAKSRLDAAKKVLRDDFMMPLIYGMLAALLAAGVWLQIASYYGWPVSTTHSIVGAIIGFGAVAFGIDAVNWPKVGAIVASWFISPLASGVISFLIFSIIRKKIFFAKNPVLAAKRFTPIIAFPVFTILILVLFTKGLKHSEMFKPIIENKPLLIFVSAVFGLIAAGIARILVSRIDTSKASLNERREQHSFIKRRLVKAIDQLKRSLSRTEAENSEKIAKVVTELEEINASIEDPDADVPTDSAYKEVERIFVYLQIISACFVAFAHGSNDVANAIGPLAAVIDIIRTNDISQTAPVAKWVLLLGGIGIVVGLATWGWRVIETVGKKITELTPTRGFSAEFGAATTIVVASSIGLPISTTHTLVGAVLGVGMARGMSSLNIGAVRNIMVSWVVTVPAGAFFAIMFFYLIRWASQTFLGL